MEMAEALRLSPQQALWHNELGDIYSAQGWYLEALPEYTSSASLAPQEASYHYNKGVSASSLGQLPESASALEEAIRLNPSFTQARYQLGKVYQAQKLLPQALAEFQLAVGLEPEQALFHQAAAMAHRLPFLACLNFVSGRHYENGPASADVPVFDRVP